MRPEEDLVLCCSRVCVDPERGERIKVLLQEDMDWTFLTRLALRHGVAPLLYSSLKSIHAQAIPSEALDQLQKFFLVNAG